MTGRFERRGAGLIALVCASLVMGAGCAPKASTGSPGSTKTTTPSTPAATRTSTAPRIDRLDPDSTVMRDGMNVEVMIRGTGFAPGEPGANSIDFGGMKLNQVRANAAGTEIRFSVPQRLFLGGEAPPQPVNPGPYNLRVTTVAGTSNTVVLRILP